MHCVCSSRAHVALYLLITVYLHVHSPNLIYNFHLNEMITVFIHHIVSHNPLPQYLFKHFSEQRYTKPSDMETSRMEGSMHREAHQTQNGLQMEVLDT